MSDMSALGWTYTGLIFAVIALLGTALFSALVDTTSRFDRVDARFDQTSDRVDRLRLDTTVRIDQTNERLDQLRTDMVAGFGEVTAAIRDLDRRLATAGG